MRDKAQANIATARLIGRDRRSGNGALAVVAAGALLIFAGVVFTGMASPVIAAEPQGTAPLGAGSMPKPAAPGLPAHPSAKPPSGGQNGGQHEDDSSGDFQVPPPGCQYRDNELNLLV